MSDKKHYMQYSDGDKMLHDATDEIVEEINEANDSVEDAIEIDDSVSADEIVEETESLIGVVSGCTKLNIRKEPNITSEPVCIVPEKSVLLIDQDLSTDEWYKVYTETGMEGFCMKKYVTVNL